MMKASVIKTLLTVTMIAFVALQEASGQQKPEADSIKKTTAVVAKAPVNKSSEYLKVTPIQNNYYNSLGAACKAELNFEKSTKVPLRVRLGSLQQTDYMEQKPNAIKPGQ